MIYARHAFLIGSILSLAIVPAFAQQQAPSPKEQALSGKLMDEFNQNIDYRAAVIGLIAQVNDLKKQLTDEQAKAAEEKKKAEAGAADLRKQVASAQEKAAAQQRQSEAQINDLKNQLSKAHEKAPSE